jgi:hypothetical protein
MSDIQIKRIVAPPNFDPAVTTPQILNVTLAADEEAVWIWTYLPDGRRAVTGYEIVKKDTIIKGATTEWKHSE